MLFIFITLFFENLNSYSLIISHPLLVTNDWKTPENSLLQLHSITVEKCLLMVAPDLINAGALFASESCRTLTQSVFSGTSHSPWQLWVRRQHLMCSLEWNSITSSQLVSVTGQKTPRQLWDCLQTPPSLCRDVISCPVQAVLTKRSGFSCGCFNGPQGPQPVFKARWDPVTAELMFPGRLGGGGLFEAHRKGGVWLWPSGWRQRQQNWGTPVTTATWACRRPPCGRVATGHVGDNQPICAASLSSCMLAVMECNIYFFWGTFCNFILSKLFNFGGKYKTFNSTTVI